MDSSNLHMLMDAVCVVHVHEMLANRVMDSLESSMVSKLTTQLAIKYGMGARDGIAMIFRQVAPQIAAAQGLRTIEFVRTVSTKLMKEQAETRGVSINVVKAELKVKMASKPTFSDLIANLIVESVAPVIECNEQAKPATELAVKRATEHAKGSVGIASPGTDNAATQSAMSATGAMSAMSATGAIRRVKRSAKLVSKRATRRIKYDTEGDANSETDSVSIQSHFGHN